MEYIEEIPRHKKKSQAKPPKKAKHKHIYKPCILEYNGCRFSKEHGIVYDEPSARLDSYCPICGKTGGIQDPERWYQWRYVPHPVLTSSMERIKTEECIKELNPETRTLPTFWVDDAYFTKFVKLEENRDEE